MMKFMMDRVWQVVGATFLIAILPGMYWITMVALLSTLIDRLQRNRHGYDQ